MQRDVDVWKFVSIISNDCETFDFKFESRQETAEFIVGLSQACELVGHKDFSGTTNITFVKMLLIKAKLGMMAKLQKCSLSGLFARAVFLTAQETLAESTFFEKKVKYEALHALLATCLNYSVRLYADEKQDYMRLKEQIESMLKVDLTN